MIPPPDAPRVLLRVVNYPHAERGERLVVYVETRTVSDPAVVVYSVTRHEFRVEHWVHLRWRTRRATLEERALVIDDLTHMGWDVRVLQAAPRAMNGDDTKYDPDESPVERRRALKTGYITCKP